MSSLLEQVGGLPAIRKILSKFYERVFSDLMIGFHFNGRDQERLIEKETELVAEALGEGNYTGRGIGEVHLPLRIMGGHFDRRLVILKETLEEFQVPEEVRRVWISHSEGLRDQVTPDAPGVCD